jgi:hypothetical protein
MVGEKKQKNVIRLARSISPPVSLGEPEPLPRTSEFSRPQETLDPTIEQLAQNVELMRKFRSVVGSENVERGAVVFDEVKRLARTLDPTITSVDATRIIVGLVELVDGQGRAPK